jgi:hypothetical protein
MLESAFLLPSLLHCAQGAETDPRLARDIVIFGSVLFLQSIGIKFARKVYVALGLFGISCEIINNLTYRILPPRKELKEQWLKVLLTQTKTDFDSLCKYA